MVGDSGLWKQAEGQAHPDASTGNEPRRVRRVSALFRR
jgi:hypothetical protein